MASWKRFSYQWRLFIPLVAIVWLLIFTLAAFQYRREVSNTQKRINDELSYVLSRILISKERNADISQFLEFIANYYDNSPYFPGIRVSIYENSDMLRNSIGVPISFDFYQKLEKNHQTSQRVRSSLDGKNYYFKGCKSNDGRYYVLLAMETSDQLTDTFLQAPKMWGIILLLGVAATVLVFMFSRYVARTIRLMRDFANNVASGKEFKREDNFPHDELGDIARHIVQIYNERDEARKRSEREHEIAIHAVSEKMRIKHQLTNNINHELKTPVGAIKGYLDTIAETPDLPPALHDKFLNSARQNVDRLVNLLNDVSAMARLEDGGSTIPLSEVDFHDIVFSIDNDLKVTNLAGKLSFSYNIPVDCMVRGNANLLNGMISNLIRNAAQHSGGTAMGLKIVSESAKFYSFSFYDNGNGVEESHLSHLFERFYRVDTGRSRKVGGTGLGLPIVKNTIEAMGGTISVHNRSNGGLEFIFTLRKWLDNETEQQIPLEKLTGKDGSETDISIDVTTTNNAK